MENNNTEIKLDSMEVKLDIKNPLDELVIQCKTSGLHNFQSINPKGKYNIPLDKFWDLYEKYNCSIGLLEYPQFDYSLLRFDIDIPVNNGTRLYTDQHIIEILKCIHELIDNCEPNTKNPMIYMSCVHEKEFPSDKSKDGIHIFFPNMIVYNKYQDTYFVEQLKNKLSNKFDKLFFVDKVGNIPWTVNFNKNPNKIYKQTKVYDKNFNLCPLNKFTPRDLSLNKEYSGLIYGIPFRPIQKKRVRSQEDLQIDEERIKTTNILNHLLPKRYNNYFDWIDIGITLYNIFDGLDKGLDIWTNWSRKSHKFKEGECEEKWKTFYTKSKTIGTLFNYLQEDNPKEYENIRFDQMIKNISRKLDINSEQIDTEIAMKCVKSRIGHHDIATIIYDRFHAEILYAIDIRSKRSSWYKFCKLKHRWIICSDSSIKNLILKDISENLDNIFSRLISDCDDDPENSDKFKKMYLNNKIILENSLKNEGFLHQCEKACRGYFENDKFFSLINTNKNLIGCENGVLDLETKTLRNGCPDDYITLSTGIYFDMDCQYSKDYSDFEEYYNRLMPNADIQRTTTEGLSGALTASNKNKCFFIFLGPQDTGKSKFVSLIEKTFGDYSLVFPQEIIYQNNMSSSSAPKPELSRVVGKRIAFIKETEAKVMNIGALKSLTGNDKLYARGLHQEGSEIELMFTLFLMANEVPKIPQSDEATWRRVIIIPFKSKFIENPTEAQIKNHIYPIDLDIDKKFDKWAPCLLWKIFICCIKNNFNGNVVFNPCNEIINATKAFRDSNNVVCKYIEERIILTNTTNENQEEFIMFTTLYEEFKEWFKCSYPGLKCEVTKPQFKHEFCKQTGKPLIKCKVENKKNSVEGWMVIRGGEF